VLSVAAVSGLVSLLLLMWPLVATGPMALIVAVSVGQLLGTIALLLFGAVVVHDLRRAHVLDREPQPSLPPPPPRDESLP
jgi:hypothetical protein